MNPYTASILPDNYNQTIPHRITTKNPLRITAKQFPHRITSSQHTTKATADDYESDGDSVDEEEIRPLTQAELKKKIIKGVSQGQIRRVRLQ